MDHGSFSPKVVEMLIELKNGLLKVVNMTSAQSRELLGVLKKKGTQVNWNGILHKVYSFEIRGHQIRIKTKVAGAALSALLLFGGGATHTYYANIAYNVVINGETVGVVADLKDGNNLVAKVLSDRGAQLGVSAKTHDQIELIQTRINKQEVKLLSEEELQQKLSSFIEGTEVVIAGESVFILPKPEDAEKLFKTYQDLYVDKGEKSQIASVSFEELVATKTIETVPEKVVSYEQALEKLKKGNVQRTDYTIQPKDSWWLVARKHDQMIEDVLAANPGYTASSILNSGKVIAIEKVKPYLTVLSEGTQTDKETIAFDVITKIDSNLQSGKKKVSQEGVDGEKEVRYTYTKKNDVIVAKTVLEEKTIKEAIPEIVAKGKPPIQVASAGYSRGGQSSGGLSRPLRSNINSYYGGRWGGFHTGVDFAGSTGTPYVAAGSGVVVSAGYAGGYGNSIVINHGNGIMTRYAHSSKMLVQPGQSVSKGQTIGLVGSTGRSTGPHLHFEVIINGNTVNPLNYVD